MDLFEAMGESKQHSNTGAAQANTNNTNETDVNNHAYCLMKDKETEHPGTALDDGSDNEGSPTSRNERNVAEQQQERERETQQEDTQQIFISKNAADNPKYLQKTKLGTGSYGSAWLVEEMKTGKRFAAKIAQFPDGMNSRHRKYALAEIATLGAMKHPNVIGYVESKEVGNSAVLVLEFADSGDISHHIKIRAKNKDGFVEGEVLAVFLQVMFAVRHLHSRSVLHRDIKSANVLVTHNGLVKLADFGFSRQYQDTVSNAVADTFCGTPHYLAPELWKSKRYSNKADMWSLGVFLYELLALQKPFQHRSLRGLMENIVAAKYAPIEGGNNYSADILGLVPRLLDPDPNTRMSSSEFFTIPFVLKQVQQLKPIFNSSAIDETTRTDIIKHIDEIVAFGVAKNSGAPSAGPSSGEQQQQQPGGEALQTFSKSPGHLEGPLFKLRGARKWCEKYIIFDLPALKCFNAKEDVGTNNYRLLQMAELDSVTIIPETVALTENVFALHTVGAKCTWLKAFTATDRDWWVLVLRQALEESQS